MARQVLVASVACLVLCVGTPVAQAEFGIAPGGFTAEMVDSAGEPEIRAGAHPDRLRIRLALNTIGAEADGNLKDMRLGLPAGLIGDPRAVPTCPREVISRASESTCPPETQIGVIDAEFGDFPTQSDIPLYNVEPRPGDLADFGFETLLITGHLVPELTPDGQSLTVEMTDLLQDVPMIVLTVELWGVPADHQTVTAVPRRALLTAPTRCDPSPTVTVAARSWQRPDTWVGANAQMSGLTDCESLAFDPRLDFGQDSGAADTPMGTRLDLLLPQADDPGGLAGDRIREVALRLPDGVALSPSAAHGLTACEEAAVHLGEKIEASCPLASAIGTASITTPLLDEPVEGKMFLGPQLPGTDYRAFIVVRASGINLKLPVLLHADPGTGQIDARISDMPAVPIDRVRLTFAGGARAPLVSAPSCGTGVASAVFTPVGGGPSVASSDPVVTSTGPGGRPCPGERSFDPSFVAGVARARAGAASPFSATIRRGDGERLLGSFGMTLPAGLSARLGSVERCSKAAAAAVACPRSSRVGSAVTEAGSGPTPYPLRGDVFLTGPYRRAPFGLMIAFRGVVGPFDLGTIAVRAALSVDPRTGRVTVRTDSLPRVVRGIQLRLQTIGLDIDRPGFITTPTSCAARRVGAVIESVGGAVARPSSRFVVGGCRGLRFRPTLSVALRDRSELRRGGRPPVRISVRSAPGGANLREVKVDLPKMLAASPIGPPAICSLEQARDGRCPPEARIGSASARTPLLSVPLRGSVYSVQPPGKGAPDVWALIHGEGVAMSFRMKARTLTDGSVRGTLVGIPDVPFSNFTMTFAGGERGLFSATRGICSHGRARRVRATARMTAHNQAKRRVQARVRTPSRC
ncbi:MAG TPA: hypothetical protein VEX36_05130 [Thermoleophilaceae bacterium]|nr:hypothetical protein [Thermoleophilaceae bacterium]